MIVFSLAMSFWSNASTECYPHVMEVASDVRPHLNDARETRHMALTMVGGGLKCRR